jgi:hypothetical protein
MNLYFYKDKYINTLNESGAPLNNGYGFRINGNTHNLTLDTVTFSGNASWAIQGIGVGSTVDALSVINCTITNNASAYSWGGSFSNLQWSNNSVSGNANNSVPTSVGFTNAIPTAIISGPTATPVNQPITFTSASTDSGGTIAHTLWDLNAGPPVVASSATYTYTTPGTYRVSLLVWDTDGRGAHAEQTVNVGSGTWYEAESLSVAAQTSGITARVGTDPYLSAGAAAFFDATASGQYVTYATSSITAGTYDVRIGIKEENNKGQWQLAISPLSNLNSANNLGPVVDEGAAGTTTSPIYKYVDLGNWTPTSTSTKAFRFTVVGKNANSSGYGIDVDYIELIPQ